MNRYLKDPLDKKETAYDYFKKNSTLNISPDSDRNELRQAYKKSLENRPEETEKTGEMWNICNTVNKRLKMDFFYYIKEWRIKDEQ
jgi:hypothetical protein